MTTQVREMTFKGESTQNVRKMARKQGMHTLFEDGMIKALKGLTTLDEVLRITQQRDGSEPVGQEVSRADDPAVGRATLVGGAVRSAPASRRCARSGSRRSPPRSSRAGRRCMVGAGEASSRPRRLIRAGSTEIMLSRRGSGTLP